MRIGLGAEVQYHFLPGELLNPWVGYGLGLDVLSLSHSDLFSRTQNSFYGFDFARLSGGANWRFSRGFGMGLFADFAMGVYFREALTVDDQRTVSESIDNQATHYWLTVGTRFVIFP